MPRRGARAARAARNAPTGRRALSAGYPVLVRRRAGVVNWFDTDRGIYGVSFDDERRSGDYTVHEFPAAVVKRGKVEPDLLELRRRARENPRRAPRARAARARRNPPRGAGELPRSLTVRRVRHQGRLEETRYKKTDDGKLYRHESDADLWLVETKGGRRATLAVPRRGQGWTYDGATTWLTNSPREGATMATKRKRAKRPPPKGYRSWKQYMAAIRPKTKGGTSVAKRAKKRAGGGRRVVIVNKPAKRRRSSSRARRNPPAFSIGGIIERGVAGALGGATIVATEVAQRLVRGRALGMPAGTLLAGAAELAVSTTAGLLVEKFMGGRAGDRYGQLIIDAGFASVIRATAKQMGAPIVAEALADDSRRFHVLPGGRVVRLNGYVPGRERAGALNGYVGGRSAVLGSYVAGSGAGEMAAAASMANRG